MTKIKKTMHETGVDEELFNKWQDEVKDHFVDRNYLALPENEVPGDIRVDARNMTTTVRRIENNTFAAHTHNVKVKEHMSATNLRLEKVERKLEEQNQAIIDLSMNIQGLTGVIRELIDDDSGVLRKKLKENGSFFDDKSVSEKTTEENTESSFVNDDFESVLKIMQTCRMDRYVFEYMDQEVEKVYDCYKKNFQQKKCVERNLS